MRRTRSLLPSAVFLLISVVLLLAPSWARAAIKYWDTNGNTTGSGNAGGSWTGSNWTTSSAGNTATTTWASGDDAVFSAGADGTGTFTIDVVSAPQDIRNLTVEEGNVTLGTSGSLRQTVGNAVWTVASGSTLTIQQNIGQAAGYSLDFQGAGNTTVTSNFSGFSGYLGASGSGTLELSGAASSIQRLYIGLGNAGGTPTQSNSGNLKVSGGSLTVTSIGYTSNNAVGTTTWTQTGGTVDFSLGGGQFFANNAFNRSNSFTADISAGTLSMTGASSYFMLNCFGTGELDVSGSATINLNKLGLCWDSNAGNTATVNLNGGTLSVGSIGETVSSTIQATASNSTLNFAGGTLQARANNTTFLTYVDTVNIKDGGATIDTQSFNITIDKVLTHFAGATTDSLTKTGNSGTLTLTANNTYTGTTNINDGTLTLQNANNNNIASSSTINVGSGAILDVTGLAGATDLVLAGGQTLKGSGTVVGNVSVGGGGIVAPGSSPGLLTINGNQTWNNGDTYQWEAAQAGTAGTDYDSIDVNGLLTFGSSGINLDLIKWPGGDIFATDTFVLWSYNTLAGWDAAVLAPSSLFNVDMGIFHGMPKIYATNLGGAGQIILTGIYVPEPSTLALGLIGLVALACRAWAFRRKRQLRIVD